MDISTSVGLFLLLCVGEFFVTGQFFLPDNLEVEKNRFLLGTLEVYC